MGWKISNNDKNNGFTMNIAIVHDWLVTNAGAEKVLKAICDIYPDADIFSLVDFLDDQARKQVINGKFAKTSFIQKLPLAKTQFRNYLPLFPKAIESLNLNGYDLIISSSWAVAKGVNKSNHQVHICYCHTPIRYAWDLYDEYTSGLKQPKKFLVQQTLKYIRNWDVNSVNRVDYFIANSEFVKNRIKKTYNMDSIVIYPPVDINKFILEEEKDDFYFTASRLVPYKKTKLIVEAFNQMPSKKLIVIGSGEEFESIKKIAKENIVLLGYQEDIVLIDCMKKAKAFIYAAIEDFGIIPIEAMSCGTPVIALGYGGTAETVIDGVTGVHFNNQTKDDIVLAVERFETLHFDPKTIRDNVMRFSTEIFLSEFKKRISFICDNI